MYITQVLCCIITFFFLTLTLSLYIVLLFLLCFFFFFSSRRRHTRLQGDWSSDVCSSDLCSSPGVVPGHACLPRPLPPMALREVRLTRSADRVETVYRRRRSRRARPARARRRTLRRCGRRENSLASCRRRPPRSACPPR